MLQKIKQFAIKTLFQKNVNGIKNNGIFCRNSMENAKLFKLYDYSNHVCYLLLKIVELKIPFFNVCLYMHTYIQSFFATRPTNFER